MLIAYETVWSTVCGTVIDRAASLLEKCIVMGALKYVGHWESGHTDYLIAEQTHEQSLSSTLYKWPCSYDVLLRILYCTNWKGLSKVRVKAIWFFFHESSKLWTKFYNDFGNSILLSVQRLEILIRPSVSVCSVDMNTFSFICSQLNNLETIPYAHNAHMPL